MKASLHELRKSFLIEPGGRSPGPLPIRGLEVGIDAWTSAAGITDGHVFGAVNRADRASSDRLGEKVIGRCSGSTRGKLAFQVSHPMTCEGPARSCAAPPAASLSRSNCSWATPQFRLPNVIWEQSRI
jgi:hypothetical protein